MKWPFNCQSHKRTAADPLDDILWENDGEDSDDSDLVTDSDTVMSVDGECDEQ